MALARLIRFVIYAVRALIRLKDVERYNISLLISILFSTSQLAFRIFAETKPFNYDTRRRTSAG
jgi:predicted nuclease of restriction endonuclease-like RecB superfamily